MAPDPSGPKTCNGEAGFTLIEALISIGLFAVILIGILQVYDSMQFTYVRSMASADVQQSVRAALDLLARDLRLAGYDPSNAIALQTTSTLRYPLPPVTGPSLSNPASEVRLVGDLDGNGTTDCVAYRLIEIGGSERRYEIQRWKANWTSGNCPWPGVWSATPQPTGRVVATNIAKDGLRVTYLPATGSTATSDPAQVRRVMLRIEAQDPVYKRGFTVETEVALRQ